MATASYESCDERAAMFLEFAFHAQPLRRGWSLQSVDQKIKAITYREELF